MERREFLKAIGMAGGLAAIGCQHGGATAAASASAPSAAGSAGPGAGPESRKAWGELLTLLADADTR